MDMKMILHSSCLLILIWFNHRVEDLAGLFQDPLVQQIPSEPPAFAQPKRRDIALIGKAVYLGFAKSQIVSYLAYGHYGCVILPFKPSRFYHSTSLPIAHD
jgi:hypothetical protein